MAMQVVKFCGVIEGEIKRRPNETEEEAISRAEARILKVLDLNAKGLFINVGLEPNA